MGERGEGAAVVTVSRIPCPAAGCKWEVSSDPVDAAQRLADHRRLSHPEPAAKVPPRAELALSWKFASGVTVTIHRPSKGAMLDRAERDAIVEALSELVGAYSPGKEGQS